MKPNLFNHTLLAVGVAAALGVSSTAMAATPTSSGTVSGGAAPIVNVATALYKVGTDTVFQPEVKSNPVTVSISETANFSLVAINGKSATDNINEDIAATPKTSTQFNHILANDGNVTDTYNITTKSFDSDIVTKNPNYLLGAADITYTVDVSKLTQAQKDDLVAKNTASGMTISGNTATGTIPNGNKITLLPGLKAELSYQAATGAQKGGDIGVGTLTATSTFISGATGATEAQKTLTNENQTIVKLPVFKIEKSATCQSKTDCTSLDLNATNTDINYSIKLTNVTTDYSAVADNFVIRDVLPAGMTLEGNVTLPSGVTAVNTGKKDIDGRQIIDITVPSLAVGANLTVSFKVKVDVAILRAAGTATNHATVYDNYDNSTPNPNDPNSYDITDSTDDTIDSPNVPTDPDGSEKEGKDTTPTITFTSRNISITDAVDQEVPVIGKVTYSHTITNKGNENEGNSTAAGGVKRPIVITITDPVTGNALSIDKTDGNKPYYSTDGGTTKTPLVDNGDGTYKLPDNVILVPNKAAEGATPTAGSTVQIGYTVVSAGTNADIDVTKETNTITVTPGGAFAPTVAPVTNETIIRGLKLEKLAAVVSATGIENLICPSDTSGLTFGKGTDINAKPYDCIVYKIIATNTFKTKDLTAVTLSDDKAQWDAQALYQADLKGLIGTSDAGVTDNVTDIKSTFATLPKEGTGTMTFSIKVKP